MKSKIKCFAAVMLAMLAAMVLETVSEKKVYARGAGTVAEAETQTQTEAPAPRLPEETAEETEKPRIEIMINGVDFSNIDLENFQLSDFSPEQWAVLADIMEAYGDGGEWSLSGLSDNEAGEGDETEEGGGEPDEKKEPIRAERKGTGTTGTAIVTSNDLQGAMEFVKITTKDDQMFFLVVDYTKEEDNVYFLDVVTVNDLLHIAETEVDADENPIYIDYSKFESKNKDAAEESKPEDGESSSDEEKEGEDKSQEKEAAGEKKSGLSGEMLQNAVLLLGIVLIGGIAFGIIYFMKIKNKKVDEDEDDFVEGEDFEDDDDEELDEIFEPDLEVEEDSEEDLMGDISDETLVDIDNVVAETLEFVGDDETDNSDF